METARTLEGSPGVSGGKHSDVQRQTKIHKDGSVEVIGGFTPDGDWKNPLLSGHPFSYGDTLHVRKYRWRRMGNPLDREIESVHEDVLDEYISIERAEEVYGVAVDPKTLEIDAQKTAKLREALAANA